MACLGLTSCMPARCRCRGCRACIRRQRPDNRDKRWLLQLPKGVPARFTLPHLPPAPDQKNISACAVNACATAFNVLMANQGQPGFRASRLFLYYNTRRYVMKLARLSVDSGCSLRDVCKAVCTYGACEEADWPYRRGLLAEEPAVRLYAGAARCGYCAVPQTLAGIMSSLVHGHPVMMGMCVYSNMRNEPLLRMPGPADSRVGSHAVLVCGYDLGRGRFTLQNCWGDGWGAHGCVEAPMEFVLDPEHCWDLWALLPTQAPQV